MKHLQYIVLGFCLLHGAGLPAQNLVPNPGFEIALENPTYSAAGQNMDPFWFTHTGSTDFFHAAYRDFVRPPATFRGFQEPASGDGMAGIISGREFLAVELLSTLQKDEIYNVRFVVNLSEESEFASDGIGVLFLEEDPRDVALSGDYDLRNMRGNIIRDTSGGRP